MNPPRLGILLAGHTPEELQPVFGRYDRMFEAFLGEHTFTYSTWAVVDGEFPASLDEADAWLITGSRHGVYEDHAWIPPLEKFIRAVYAADLPLVGICFGHQILAQALGGRVEKFSGGWSVGRVTYTLDASLGIGDAGGAPLLACHQDQVVTLPPDATVVGSSPFCQYAALAYGDKAFSLQPHPEFNDAFIEDLVEARADTFPRDVRKAATESLGKALVTNEVARLITGFLQRRSRAE